MWAVSQYVVQYVSVIAWVFDFRKFITITDVSLQWISFFLRKTLNSRL